MKIVLPEQIALELRPATFGSRALAYITDLIFRWTSSAIICLAFVLLAVYVPSVLNLLGEISAAFEGESGSRVRTTFIIASIVLLFFFLQWGYAIYFEVVKQGVTPGKRLFGLRVVSEKGLPPNLRTSFLRTAFLLVDLLPAVGIAALISMMATRRSQRLGDLVAATLVVYDEHIPIVSQNRAGTKADVTIPLEHYQLLYTFLSRRYFLAVGPRNRAAKELSELLQPYFPSEESPTECEVWLEKVYLRSFPARQTYIARESPVNV